MREFERNLIAKANAKAEDEGLQELFEFLIPDFNAGELILELYETGLIPEDRIEAL